MFASSVSICFDAQVFRGQVMEAIVSVQEANGVVLEFPVRRAAGQGDLGGSHVRSFGPGDGVQELRGLEGMHLTRRGRFIVLALAILGSLGLGLFLGAVANASEPVAGVPVSAHAVIAGESLWEIAAGLDLKKDTRDVVVEIMEINGLRDSSLQAGQLIYVPQSVG